VPGLHDRASFLRAAGGMAAAMAVASGAACGGSGKEKKPETPDEALRRLMDGNANFVDGKLTNMSAITERREDVAAHQQPFAVILTCADSRVPPEHIFDQTLGHLFVCRVAGNILQSTIVGSIEYAIDHFHTPLVMVLGHQRCGAVEATVELVEKGGTAPGSIGSIVERITPAVKATKRGSKGKEAYVDAVVKTNARLVAREIPARSEIAKKEVDAHTVRVVAADYSLDSGKVILL
jgi:carbonic anhydrase